MPAPALLALALALTAQAQPAPEAARLDPPLPAAGDPWSAQVTAYALPPQDVGWITDEAPARACEVEVAVSVKGEHTVSPLPVSGCPQGMLDAAVAATGSWRFLAPEGAEGPTRLRVRYVFLYNATLGTTTLHAELDPGAAFTDERGAPGLMLVHRAGPPEPITAKLPKKAKKAGVGPTTCTFLAQVDAGGGVLSLAPRACPDRLSEDAARRLRAARLDPKTVDGLAYPDETVLTVSYR